MRDCLQSGMRARSVLEQREKKRWVLLTLSSTAQRTPLPDAVLAAVTQPTMILQVCWLQFTDFGYFSLDLCVSRPTTQISTP